VTLQQSPMEDEKNLSVAAGLTRCDLALEQVEQHRRVLVHGHAGVTELPNHDNSRIAQHVHDVPDAHNADGGLAELGFLIQRGSRWGDEVSHLEVLVQNMAAVDQALSEKLEGEAMLIVS